jgi:Zn-dependent M28 family amino/carboxypeptidase
MGALRAPLAAPWWTACAGSEGALRRDVERLAADLGERNLRDDARYDRLRRASDFVAGSLAEAGYVPVRHEYSALGRIVDNIEAEIEGVERPEEIVIVGAHYDSAERSPGANDNATGAAALLALARSFARERPSRTIRFVAFTNEEAPFTRTAEMGSLVYARRCRELGADVRAMLSLDALGSPAADRRDGALALVSNRASRRLSDDVLALLREDGRVRCSRAPLLGLLPGVQPSDPWAFWENGYPAVMLTCGATLRYRRPQPAGDTIDRIDFGRLAAVAASVARAVDGLANGDPEEPFERPVIP